MTIIRSGFGVIIGESEVSGGVVDDVEGELLGVGFASIAKECFAASSPLSSSLLGTASST